ncbi:MAG: 4Fe-4S binding protein [Methylotenera sp.]|nr:4Fe-4S binding protein [Methylotenera sp.]MDP1755325.1 4Fe-4S binding protein [Methylotenera sp.]MDP1958847.1 4Fe-4S binding protein [Methylotenera sp.]MDP3943430.1 4Fe-4S binding protein [Methylotenera sp.]
MNTRLSLAAYSAIHQIKVCITLICCYLIIALSFSATVRADDDKNSDHEKHDRHATATHSGSYEAPLPAQISTDPDLCAYVPCSDVYPNADYFSPRKGRPAYVEAYRSNKSKGKDNSDQEENNNHEGNNERELIGYVFLSTDIVDIPAYSGKPVVTLIAMNIAGKIVGVKILKHSEPILLAGIPEGELTKFIKQFVGKYAWDKLEIGKARAEGGYIGIDAISGATVTVIAENQVIMRCAYEVAKQVGIIKAVPRPQAKFMSNSEQHTWNELLAENSIQHLIVSQRDVGLDNTKQPYIDLYFGYLNAPAIGQSILGERNYKSLMAELKPNEHAIFIVANGTASFKGSGFVRGGIYDRIQVSQDMDSFTFRDTDYRNLYNIQAAGAPEFSESAIFIIRNTSFSAAYPWSLVFLGNKVDKQTGTRTFANFDREYWLEGRYLDGGRPIVVKTDPTWLKIWKSRIWEIAAFVVILIFTAVVYANRDWLVRRSNRKDKRWVSIPKYAIWLASIGFIGFGLMAQPSITQVLTWFHSMLFQWKWELFLSDPFIFIFWLFIIITVFVWGRGLFCGWMCPFGSLSELLYKIAGKVGLKRFQFMPNGALHERLKWLKYGIFWGLLAVSFFSMGLAEKLAEVEPFKTTFLVGLFNRSWPYTLFTASLLGLSLFTERPFCKYLCPLGAALAMPTTFRWFGLKRKQECTTCAACAVGCGSLAIDKQGVIDHRECMLCLDCMILYYDDHACPPLSKERKLRDKSGVPLTRINSAGYYIPIHPVAAKGVDE